MKLFWFGAGPVRNAGVLVRLGAIGAVMLSVAGAFAYVGGWFSPARLTQLVGWVEFFAKPIMRPQIAEWS
jgi:hypothetical protein